MPIIRTAKHVEFDVELSQEEVRRLVDQLSMEEQLEVLANIVNKWDSNNYRNLKPSELQTAKLYLQKMLNEMEGV